MKRKSLTAIVVAACCALAGGIAYATIPDGNLIHG